MRRLVQGLLLLGAVLLAGSAAPQWTGGNNPIFFAAGGSSCSGNDAFTKSLLHFDGSLADTNAGGAAHAWTAHGTANTSSAPKFGTASAGFSNVTNDYANTPNSPDFILGSSNFTIDFWFNNQGGVASSRILAAHDNGTQSDLGFDVVMYSPAGGDLQAWFSTGGTTGTRFVVSTGQVVAGTGWHHFAVVRNGTAFTAYLDGTGGAPVTQAGAVWTSTSTLAVGGAASAGAGFIGFVDEFRISVGVARWTSNFSPPSAAYCP